METTVQVRFLKESAGRLPGELARLNAFAAEDVIKNGIAVRFEPEQQAGLSISTEPFKAPARTSSLISLDIRAMEGLLKYYEKLLDEQWVSQRQAEFQAEIDKHQRLINELQNDVDVVRADNSPFITGRQRLDKLRQEFRAIRQDELDRLAKAEGRLDRLSRSSSPIKRPATTLTPMEKMIRQTHKSGATVEQIAMIFSMPVNEVEKILK